MSLARLQAADGNSSAARIGSLAHLGIFAWALLLVTLAAARNDQWVEVLGLLVVGAIYPLGVSRLARPRWLLLFVILFGVTMLFGDGEPDLLLLGLPLASQNLLAATHMLVRAMVILLAADGLATSIDVTEVAGLFERVGLSGLGFSLGVAVNLMPNIREAVTNAWHVLLMRGGFRAQWWRGLQLFFLTVLTNALRRSDDIVLAAESRAYSPERSRKFSLRVGRLDWLILLAAVFSILLVLLLPG